MEAVNPDSGSLCQDDPYILTCAKLKFKCWTKNAKEDGIRILEQSLQDSMLT